MKAAANQPLEGFVAIALGCGLRLGEALGLQWRDVDLEAGTLRVRHALQRTGGDTLTRRPLLKERKWLLNALEQEQSREQRRSLRAALQEAEES